MQSMTDPNGLPAGADVLDKSGELVGTLDTVNARKGHLTVLKGIFFVTDIYLPMSAVDHVDSDGIHLALGKDELTDVRFQIPPDGDEAQKNEIPLDDTHTAGEPRII